MKSINLQYKEQLCLNNKLKKYIYSSSPDAYWSIPGMHRY